jgi:hypothetical protein
VIAVAAAALSRLDVETQNEVDDERARVDRCQRDRQRLAGAFTTLQELAATYPNYPSDLQTMLLDVQTLMVEAIDAEAETWLPAAGRGSPRRHDYDQLARIICALHTQGGWNIQTAAGAVSDLVDQVWDNDDRTRSAAIRLALWGASVENKTAEQRRIDLRETLRKRAHDLMRAGFVLSK